MSLGEIFVKALLYTLIGMGTVFCVLVFISLCIWLMGRILAPKPTAAVEVIKEQAPPEPEGIRPEVVAAITAAIHMQLKAEEVEEGYIVRNIRRAQWRHTS